MAGIFSFSATAGSNTSIGGVSVAEGMSPANVNNALRQIPAEIAVTFSDSALETFFNGTAPLPITKGGTGGATASAAIAALGALASTYKGLPRVAKAAGFTLATADEGVGYRYTGGAAAVTIDPVGTTPYTVGAIFPLRNAHNSTGALTITRGAGVALRIAGQTTDANVTLAVAGDCFLEHESSNVWVVRGTGIS